MLLRLVERHQPADHREESASLPAPIITVFIGPAGFAGGAASSGISIGGGGAGLRLPGAL
ncbi:MAG: hypothetical protein R2939_19110 [Kofleriaceae bacterium]